MTKSNKKHSILERFPLAAGLEKQIEAFLQYIKNADKILISSTLTSDGDSIGAQIGVFNLIKALRKEKLPQIHIVNHSPVPDRYAFLSDTDQIMTLDEWKSKNISKDYDLGIVCDGGVERTGPVAALFDGISNLVLIDHHIVGSELNYSAKILDTESSSTCEIVYQLFEFAGIEVTPNVAEHLYLGIVFDTGFFKHSITTPKTHHVAAELIATGIDFSRLCDQALLERTWSGQLLLRKMMINMESILDGRVVYSHWTLSDLEEVEHIDGDQEGMINQLYYTEGCEVVALFVELSNGKTKISFRSKGDFNVAEFARELTPHGGGHVKAAGCTLDTNWSGARELVLKRLQDLLG